MSRLPAAFGVFTRAILLLLLLALPLHAQEPARAERLPEPLSPFVSDYAGVLDAPAQARLEEHLRALRRDPGVEVALATIARQADLGGDGDIARLARDLFNHWGIGDAGRNDGILILMAIEDREIRIALGAGYPPVWDGRAQRVIEALMLPAFAAGDYAKGLEAGLEGLETYLIRPFRAGVSVTGTEGMPDPAPARDAGDYRDLGLFGLVIALILGMVGWQNRHRMGDAIAVRRPCPSCGGRGIVIERSQQADGPLRITRHCPQCGHDESRYDDPPSAEKTEGAGGSDGFGGGSSDGGGASGRW